MPWYHLVAYFFGGALLANTVPHFANGISGRPFQTPFASPRGVGLSSSTVNVLWGLCNLLIGYLLVCRVGNFDLRNNEHVLDLGVGALIMSLGLARRFGRSTGVVVRPRAARLPNEGEPLEFRGTQQAVTAKEKHAGRG